MKKISFILSLLLFSLSLSAHPWKPAHYVIIDTDGGTDDIKAITMFLASPDVRVLAVTTSAGVLDARTAYIKVKSLLNFFYHEGLPVGINANSGFNSPQYPVASNLKWGEETLIDRAVAPDAITLIKEILSAEKTKISFLCLGSMSTVYKAGNEIPGFNEYIKDIIWSANGLSDTKGFNFNIDRKAADKMLNGLIPVKVVKGTGDDVFYDESLLKDIEAVNTLYGKKMVEFFNSPSIINHPFAFTSCDDITALYVHFPGLFKEDISGINYNCSPLGLQPLKDGVIKILKGETVPRNQVIKSMPDDPSFYFDDINSSVKDIIIRYGIDEWTSGVIANELHRHLGVFAIVGVKMGIRAREYFDTGVDEFSAVSFAGSTPPLSCMNDGLQVSTGATPGHGLLTVRNDTTAYPSALFTYMNRRIRITLKPEIAAKISAELREINFVNGLDSDIYWELVRKNSIKYWLNLDRHEVFIINAE